MRLRILPALLGMLLTARAAAAQEWNLTTLMDAMRQVRASTARFSETKTFQLLSQPQHTVGLLDYRAPDHLRKETTAPARSVLAIDGDTLTMEQPGQPTRQMSLRDYPEIAGLAQSVRATLAGDQATLTRYFDTGFSGGIDDWTLTLVPKDPHLRQLVSLIRIQGDRTAIRDVLTQEADGDRTDMVVLPNAK